MDMHHQEHGGATHPKPPPKAKPPPDPTFGGHGQLIVGTGPIYLSHLPMFMFDPASHPHNFQVLLEVTFTASGGSDPQETYVRDRLDTGTRVYTLAPEKFVMLDLVRPDRKQPTRPLLQGRHLSAITSSGPTKTDLTHPSTRPGHCRRRRRTRRLFPGIRSPGPAAARARVSAVRQGGPTVPGPSHHPAARLRPRAGRGGYRSPLHRR